MINIKRKKEILVITEEDVGNSSNQYFNINILKIKISRESVIKINETYREKYNYIFFTKECKFKNELINYLPVYFIDNCCNKLFINELIVNPILMEYANLVSDSIGTIEIGIFLKHILRNNIKQDNFHFYKELKEMKKLHNCSSNDIHYFKKNFYNAVEQHYSQNSIIRKIKFRFNKANIVKKLLYKILDNVVDGLKNTNKLVFKKVCQYRHITHQE